MFYGHYVFLMNYIFFTSSLAYLFSVVFSRRKRYDYLLGFLTTSSTTVLTIISCTKLFPTLPYQGGTYYNILSTSLFMNFYICLNSHYLLKKRAQQFEEEDDLVVFLRFTFDVFWMFPKNMIESLVTSLDHFYEKYGKKH